MGNKNRLKNTIELEYRSFIALVVQATDCEAAIAELFILELFEFNSSNSSIFHRESLATMQIMVGYSFHSIGMHWDGALECERWINQRPTNETVQMFEVWLVRLKNHQNNNNNLCLNCKKIVGTN